ncbi:uncharacterized protein KZ484_018765 [Pholidichthys leucotaenia]
MRKMATVKPNQAVIMEKIVMHPRQTGRGTRKQKGPGKGASSYSAHCEAAADDNPAVSASCGQEKEEERAASGVSEAHASPEMEIAREDEEQQAKKKRSKTYTHVSHKQEEMTVAWLQSNEILYNKKLESYKDVKKKAHLWQSCWVGALRCCRSGTQAHFTKLKKMNSGDSAAEASEQGQWVLANFIFLASFCYDVKKRTLVCLKSKMLPPIAPQPPAGEDDDDDKVITSSVQPADVDMSTRAVSSTTTSNSCASTPNMFDSLSSAVSGMMDQFLEMQKNLVQHVVRPNTDCIKEAFIDYIRESVYDMHLMVQDEMQRDIMKAVLRFNDKDAEMKRRLQHPSDTLPGFSSAPSGSSASASWQPPPHM